MTLDHKKRVPSGNAPAPRKPVAKFYAVGPDGRRQEGTGSLTRAMTWLDTYYPLTTCRGFTITGTEVRHKT